MRSLSAVCVLLLAAGLRAAPPEVPAELRTLPAQNLTIRVPSSAEIGHHALFGPSEAFFEEMPPLNGSRRFMFQAVRPGRYTIVFWTVGESTGVRLTIVVGDAADPPVAPGPQPKPVPPATPPREGYLPDPPAGAVQYNSARFTQAISVLFTRGRDYDQIRPVRVADLPDKRWHQPGGLEGVRGWTAERFRLVPGGQKVRTWVGNIGVKNSDGFIQQNRGLLRSYPDGTRFDEVLRNEATGLVFEHRVRLKKDGRWLSEVYHRDESQYPRGYSGLKVSCSSCHREAGTGGYAVGLVPGGDTVLGDPLPWELWLRQSPEK